MTKYIDKDALIDNELLRDATLRLLPCPHCGGKATGVVWLEYFLDMSAWPTARVICGECNSMMDTKRMSKEQAIEDAIKKWNNRY